MARPPILEPLRIAHADQMALVLDNRALYEYTGGEPPNLGMLRARYARQAVALARRGAWVIELDRV